MPLSPYLVHQQNIHSDGNFLFFFLETISTKALLFASVLLNFNAYKMSRLYIP